MQAQTAHRGRSAWRSPAVSEAWRLAAPPCVVNRRYPIYLWQAYSIQAFHEKLLNLDAFACAVNLNDGLLYLPLPQALDRFEINGSRFARAIHAEGQMRSAIRAGYLYAT